MDLKDPYYRAAVKIKCEQDHLYFTRYFFKQRFGSKFQVNWHHMAIAEAIDKVISGETQNLVINVSPGSSKTELVIINLIARGLALNPRARFLHLSYSDDLALTNSQTAKDIVMSDEYQALWPLEIANDSKAKGRWNVMQGDKNAGGVYATSIGGQVTGFRAGHMADSFQGAVLIDDPVKPEDAFSKTKTNAANRKLLTTVRSRRASSKTPIIVIMQRVSEKDATAFIESGAFGGKWEYLSIPAIIDSSYVASKIPDRYRNHVDTSTMDEKRRFSYWQFKEPIEDLVQMEQGTGRDDEGNLISRHVFSSQYMQAPRKMGGNILKGADFKRYIKTPPLKYRIMYADTASQDKEHNDYSVFQCWGMGEDGRIYLLDQIRGKWLSPELKRRALAFIMKHLAVDDKLMGPLRMLKPENKSSGIGLIQELKAESRLLVPVIGIERNKDRYTRVQDALPYIEQGFVCIPEMTDWESDFLDECEAYRPDDTHDHDDQIDPMLDAVQDNLTAGNKMKIWEKLGQQIAEDNKGRPSFRRY